MKKSRNFALSVHFLVASIVMCASVAFCAGAGSRAGNESLNSNVMPASERLVHEEYKTPRHLFGAPAENTPALQLARAKRFEAASRHGAACNAYNALVHNWGNSAEAAEAQLSLAALLELRRKFSDSFKEYQYYIDYYSAGNTAPGVIYTDVILSQYSVADELRKQLGTGWSSPSYELVAAMFRQIVRNAPDWDRAPECVLMEGMSYVAARKFDKAIPVFERLMAKYPSSRFAADAAFQTATCRYELAVKAPNDDRTTGNAVEACRYALRTYPSHADYAATAEKMAAMQKRQVESAFAKASFYDKIRKNPDAAILAYQDFIKRFPASEKADEARARIEELATGQPADRGAQTQQ